MKTRNSFKLLLTHKFLAADGPEQHLWLPLSSFLLYNCREKLGERGNLTLVSQALSAVESWLTTFSPATLEQPTWSREMAGLFSFKGELAVARGELNNAADFFQQYLDIAQRLALSDPDNSEWQHDLAVSHFKLFELAQKAEDETTGRETLASCYQVLAGMEQRGMHLDPAATQLYQQLKATFANSEDSAS